MAREGYWARQLRPVAQRFAELGREQGLSGKDLLRYVRSGRPGWVCSEGGSWGMRAWAREVHFAVTGVWRPVRRSKRKSEVQRGEPDQGRLF